MRLSLLSEITSSNFMLLKVNSNAQVFRSTFDALELLHKYFMV